MLYWFAQSRLIRLAKTTTGLSACPLQIYPSGDQEGGFTFVKDIIRKLNPWEVIEHPMLMSTMLSMTEWAVGTISVCFIDLGRPTALRSPAVSVHPGVWMNPAQT